ncbi:Frepeat-containingbox/WD 1A-like [Octopus vulgaris]|uniref:Frepeat-containingbox/WD 1A-like n=2 Tax=Octopus vulgaris TaxID=6645 RepID=A0AA36ATF3_OCTVU|nr:Frepeat-containingbox/WD 1A-like [Octopus vulgaris]
MATEMASSQQILFVGERLNAAMFGSNQNNKLHDSYHSSAQPTFPVLKLHSPSMEKENATFDHETMTNGSLNPEQQSFLKSFGELSCHCSNYSHCHQSNIPSKANSYHQQTTSVRKLSGDPMSQQNQQRNTLNEISHLDIVQRNGESILLHQDCSSQKLQHHPNVLCTSDSSKHSLNNSLLCNDVEPTKQSNAVIENVAITQSSLKSQKSHLPLCIYSRGKLNCVSQKKKISATNSTKYGVSPKRFRKCTEEMGKWFLEFNDEQKNIFLKGLLKGCELPQLHLLSVKMEPNLHRGCPPNCQDIITWLPTNLATKIMSFLDPVTLCRSSQVCKIWRRIGEDPTFWRRFCCQPKWQLSKLAEHKQVINHMSPEGCIQWKRVFAERFRLRNNWLKGRCTVRTFEGHTQGISCIQFDDTRIVSGSSDKTIRVWNIRTNAPWSVQTLVGHSGTVRCLHLEGNRLVSGSSDKTIKVWDLSTQDRWSSIACKVTMVGHLDTVRCLQADDEKLISGSYDKTLKVWDIRTGECKMKLRGHSAAVLCVRFNESKIVSGSADKTIKVWNFDANCIMTLDGHQNAVTCLQFDSTRIVSGSLDCNLKFWDIHTGVCVNTIDWKAAEGHTGVVRCLQADSWRVVSAADDKTIKVWNLETGKRLITLRNHSDGVTCLQFSDFIIVSGSYDKTVKLWDFSCC